MIPLAPSASVELALHPRNDQLGQATLARVINELPDPRTLAPGTWVSLDAGAPKVRGLWQRLRGAAAGLDLALRCTALFTRGYVRVCADADGVAYGQVPERG